jgi:hypothetical protein
MTRLADRVKEVSSTTGTGSIALGGAVAGYRAFLATLGAGAVYYTIAHQSVAEWEVGIGTLTTGPDTLARTTVLASSNAGALTNFSAGLKDVFCTAPAAAFVTVPTSMARISGLVGLPNAATPLTKYDFAADGLQLRNPTDGSIVVRGATGTVTNDLALAGPVVNGRDQSAAFTASSWVYAYFIWNGTTVGTVTSVNATTPVLPTGYTHAVKAGALRLSAATQFVPTQIRDAYASIAPSTFRASAVGTNAEQSYDLSAFIPPAHQGAAITALTGAGNVQGDIRVAAGGQVALTTNVGSTGTVMFLGRVPLVSQTCYFIGSSATSFILGVQGYWMKA